MRLRRFLLAATAAFALGAGASALRPAPAAAEEARASVDVSFFWDALAPHGDWVRTPAYGWVWVPEEVDWDWRPYLHGQWVWVEEHGWTWVSTESYGWAVYHYGRWAWIDGIGWAWVPGTVWAPAWVEFRVVDGWIGWAPRPPETGWRLDLGLDVGGLNVSFEVGAWGWSFVPVPRFAEPTVHTYVVRSVHNPRFLRASRPVTRWTVADGRLVLRGPELETVERARGSRLVRHRIREDDAAGPTRVEGETVRVRRPRVEPRAPEKGPSVKARADVRSEEWVEKRRAALRAHLDAQKKAAESDDDPAPAPTGGATPPPPPPAPGMGNAPPPPPPAMGDAPPSGAPGRETREAAREAAKKALEDERKRSEEWLEWQRRRREGRGSDDAPPAPGMGDDRPGMGDDDAERRAREEKEKKEKEKKEKEEKEREKEKDRARDRDGR